MVGQGRGDKALMQTSREEMKSILWVGKDNSETSLDLHSGCSKEYLEGRGYFRGRKVGMVQEESQKAWGLNGVLEIGQSSKT